ncbi:hypothetical protein BH11CYA1_BH11CYA1_20470 [soil metagenome]
MFRIEDKTAKNDDERLVAILKTEGHGPVELIPVARSLKLKDMTLSDVNHLWGPCLHPDHVYGQVELLSP